MTKVRLTPLAESDLQNITEYSLRTWGARQTGLYLQALESRFEILMQHPEIERSCDEVLPGLLRQKEGHHTIFYLKEAHWVTIVRILHESMNPDLHDFIDEWDDDLAAERYPTVIP